MTDNEKLRYEYFIETGIVWIDTNDRIELDYLKWLESKIIYTRCSLQLKDKQSMTFDEWIINLNKQGEIDFIDKERNKITSWYELMQKYKKVKHNL